MVSQEHSFHLVIKGYEMPHILPWNDQAVRKYGVSEGISVPPPTTAKTEVVPLPSSLSLWLTELSHFWMTLQTAGSPHRNDEKVEMYLPKEISFHSPSLLVLCKHVLIIPNGFP